MTKYTKRQYRADIAANEAKAKANADLLKSFEDRANAGESIAAMSDDWNDAHDATYAIESERQDIESRFRRRNWTWQDHSHHDLVMNNCD